MVRPRLAPRAAVVHCCSHDPLFATFPTEQSAIDHLTAIRFGNGVVCPLCGCTEEGKAKRMSRAGAHTNSIESVWALLKRQYVGTHHWISPKHLDAYLNEITCRLNRSDLDKGQRHQVLLSQIEGPMPWKVLTA